MEKSNLYFLLIISIIPNNYVTCLAKNAQIMLLAGPGNGGRLGDNVLLYSKAKYISYKYNIPLLYKNLPLFDQLALSIYEKMYTKEHDRLFKDHTALLDCRKIPSPQNESILLEVGYYCQMRKEINKFRAYVGCAEYPFDWFKKKMIKYPNFGNELKRDLQLRDSYNRHMPQLKDSITVAVATRMGSGGDDPSLISEQFFPSTITKTEYRGDNVHPFKFVPQQFYIDQVKRLSSLLQHRKMHIYFFIDKDKPFAEDILAKWRQALIAYKNITIECNVEKNWKERIFDDLYIMSHCDCLIRGCSHFAGIAQLAGDHKIIIGPDPISFTWSGKRLIFTKTFIYFQNINENTFQQYVYEDTPKDVLSSLAASTFK